MQCRSCGAETEQVLSLGAMPLANHLLEFPSEVYESYPLDLMFCPQCKLGQLKYQVQPELMFQEYVYYSSVNQPVVEESKKLVDQIVYSDIGDRANLYVEIGSNDGYLLQHYNNLYRRVLGIDPARGPSNAAALKGIPVVQDYFTLKLAKTLPKADVIHAHNVLAHVRDLNDFVAGIAEMLKPEGVCVVEVPYLEDMVNRGTFCLIYHEHNYYFSTASAIDLFKRHGLFLFQVEHIQAHGGSLRMWFSKDAGKSIGWVTMPTGEGPEQFDFPSMVLQIQKQNYDFMKFVRGRRVWGFGAAAKATVILNFCNIGSDLLPMIADSTPAKIGKFIPGTGQRIVHPDDWLREQPEWTCIFAWNYEEEIRAKYKDTYKGTFFTPYKLPQ